jgi:predicted ATP-dependent serine protease
MREAERLGFARAVVPCTAPPLPAGMEALRVSTVAEAMARLGLWGREAE